MADISLEPISSGPAVDTSRASLADRLAALRRRTGFVVTERTLLTVGSVLMPLGLVFVLLGWYGAAHTTRVFEQIPYMISGGMLGIVCMIAGGFCYFGYFLARMLATSREMLDSMLRLEERFETLGLSAPSPVDRGARLPLVPLVATKTGTMYHRPECPAVAGRPPAELRTVRATDGLTACKMCIPDPSISG
ncbi:MAG: hypothetical protein QOH79_2529 [Acidimicrobiaceae bacterium]|jgi:hypothetical protein